MAEPQRAGLDWSGVLLVGGIALLAALAGLRNEFAQDDLYLIQENVRIHDLGNWREMLNSPFWPSPYSQDLYRPLTSLLLSLEFALGGGSPLVFRLFSYLCYAAVAAGVFVLASRLLPRSIALAVGMLFAAHPVHVEAVALGVGQSELIVGLLALGMGLFYLDRRRRGALRPRDWALLAGLYLTAGLFKEQGVVLPACLLAVELFLCTGSPGERFRRLLPGYGLLAGTALLLLLLRRVALGGELAGTFTAEALVGLTLYGRTLTMLTVVPHWARLLLWPAHLQGDYSPQELVASTGFGGGEVVGLLLLLAALAALWLARRRAPVLSFGLAWCAVALLPVSNLLLPTGIVLAERTLFLPSIGVVLGLGALLAVLAGPAVQRPLWKQPVVGLLCGVLVLAGVLRSSERQGTWRNDAVFAVRGVGDAPRSFRMRRAYAEVLFELGRRDQALEAYQQAIALSPRGQAWRVRNDLARRLRALGESSAEAEQLRASLAEEPAQEETRGYLIAAVLALGRYAEAAAEADSALARGATPQVFGALRRLADSAARVGAAPGAIRIRINAGPSRPIRPGG